MRRTLGSTDLEVFPVGLGAMPLGIRGTIPLKDAIKVIHAAIDAGMDFIDTANVYCTDNQDLGLNERTIASALESIDSSRIVVATKGGLVRPQGRWERRGSPQELRVACEQSLRDLKVDVIQLYQLHAPDPTVPFSDSVGELARLQHEGKIRHIGLSNVGESLVEEAMEIATISTVQNRCNVYYQNDLRNGFVDFCANHSITYIAYSPVGGGSRHGLLKNEQILQELAAKHEATVYQIVLAWLLQKGDNILPIPGASKISSAVSSTHAVNVNLSKEDVDRVDSIGEI